MIKRLFACPDCDNRMTGTQTALGLIWLPVHFVLMPLLAAVYIYAVPGALSLTELNMLIMGVSVTFVLITMREWLRRCFDVLLDGLRRCALCLCAALCANYALTIAINLVMLLLGAGAGNPNDAALDTLAREEYGVTMAITVFLAPLVEETLFRGALFGTIRRKSRAAAYIVSALLFSLAHVWQYALAYLDARLLVYMLEYIPVSLVLAWMYERSGSIWTPVFFHIVNNSFAFYVLTHF